MPGEEGGKDFDVPFVGLVNRQGKFERVPDSNVRFHRGSTFPSANCLHNLFGVTKVIHKLRTGVTTSMPGRRGDASFKTHAPKPAIEGLPCPTIRNLVAMPQMGKEGTNCCDNRGDRWMKNRENWLVVAFSIVDVQGANLWEEVTEAGIEDGGNTETLNKGDLEKKCSLDLVEKSQFGKGLKKSGVFKGGKTLDDEDLDVMVKRIDHCGQTSPHRHRVRGLSGNGSLPNGRTKRQGGGFVLVVFEHVEKVSFDDHFKGRVKTAGAGKFEILLEVGTVAANSSWKNRS
jgi:hypothetical protein